MKSETEEVIKKKFERSLKAHRRRRRKEDLKNLFNDFEIPFNQNTAVAYFLGILRAIAYDSKAFIEGRGLKWVEFSDTAGRIKDEILRFAKTLTAN